MQCDKFKMSSYRKYKNEALKDANVKQAYDELGHEYDIIQAMIDVRKAQNMT